MSTTLTVLTKVYVRSFYAENATFFLVMIGVGGGFMSGVEHKALAEFFISMPAMTFIPVLIWVLYAVKIINFNIRTTARKENEFAYSHALYPDNKQFFNTSFVLFGQLAPVFAYATFLTAMALKHQAVASFAIIVAGFVAILVSASVALKTSLRKPGQNQNAGVISRSVNRWFVRPYAVFIVEWLSRKKTFLLISTMTFCSLVLLGVLMLYTTDHYDSKLLQMALILVVSGNIQLIEEIHRFETVHFTMVAQMPLSFSRRLSYLLPAMIFISFPQLGLLVRYFPSSLSITFLIECVAFIIGYSFFLYGWMYNKHRSRKQLMRIVFACALIFFVLTLFSLPIWLITLACSSFGIFTWRKNFYRFETTGDKEG